MKIALLVLMIFTFVVSAQAEEITDSDILIIKAFESQLDHPALLRLLVTNLFDVLSIFYEYKTTEPPKDKNKMFLYENNPPAIDGFLDCLEHALERKMNSPDFFVDFNEFRKKVKSDYNILLWIEDLSYSVDSARKKYDQILRFQDFGKEKIEETK